VPIASRGSEAGKIASVTTRAEARSLFDPQAYAAGCPHGRFAALRADQPVSWQPSAVDLSLAIPEVEGGWWVHRYADVKATLRDNATFSSERRTALLLDVDEGTAAAMANMLINMDPPAHGNYRRRVAAAFTPRRLALIEPRVSEIARSVVDAVAPLGACDAVHDIAAPMPMTVIAELLGIPERSRDLFDISNRMVGAIDVDDPRDRAEQATMASIEIQLLGQQLAAEKRRAPDDSLLSAYVNGGLEESDDGNGGCTDAEAGWFLLLLAAAGNETVRTATAQAIRTLADHPAQRDLLVDDIDARLPGAIEEILRFASPVRAIRRTSTRPTDIAGVAIPTDAKVVCHFSSALRDEREFENPDTFDIERPLPSQQLAFGFGEHYCLGASLARLQLRTILREIYTRIPDIHPTSPPVPQPTPLLEGLLSMPVAFTPEDSS
jgi:cholest-4-en-3-one 26-monooxygenase